MSSDYIPCILPAGSSCDIDAPICQRCRNWLAEALSDSKGVYSGHHGGNVETLLASAVTCKVCNLIAQELYYRGVSKDVMDRRLNDSLSFRLFQRNQTIASDSRTGYGSGKFLTRGTWNSLNLIPVPDTYPSTTDALETARQWIDRCLEWHSLCSDTRTNTGLPKRVLDTTTLDDTVILYESKGESVPYATLSYCWGDGVPLTTTLANIEQHRKGISLHDFPETLQDAILFAKNTGLRYILVDALCIVQDDPLDWAEQAAAMTEIYRGCRVNIAMTDSPGCTFGTVRKLQDCSVHVGASSRPSVPVGLAKVYIVIDPTDGMDLSGWSISPTGIRYNPSLNRLATRGWVFQETLVSVATVHMTHQGLIWDCCSEECLEGNKPRRRDHPHQAAITKASWALDHKIFAHSSDAGNEMPRAFYHWVTHFSTRQLSKPNDKLPVLAGLVSQLATLCTATYVAGLWKEDLHVGLSWLAVRSGSLTRRNDRAPSWSWASVDGKVKYSSLLSRNFKYTTIVNMVESLDLQILTVVVDEIYPGSYGEVRGGRIEGIGTLQQGSICGDSEKPYIEIGGQKVFALICALDERRNLGNAPCPCWLLRITSLLVPRAGHGRGPHVIFLILEETGAQESEFRRIGMAFFDESLKERDSNVSLVLLKAQQRKRVTLV